jgi:hypothetical protein
MMRRGMAMRKARTMKRMKKKIERRRARGPGRRNSTVRAVVDWEVRCSMSMGL